MNWLTFDTVEEARKQALAWWLDIVAQPEHDDATDAGVKLITAFIDVATLKAEQLDKLTADGVPLYGRDSDGNVVTDRGVTLRWCEPRQTAKGQWAVVCPPGVDGGDEPVWPETPPLDGKTASAAEGLSAEVLHERG